MSQKKPHQSNHISLSKRFRLFYTKNLLFLFYTITFTKHSHQFIYYTYFFIKINFFLTFFIISHLPHQNHKVSASHFPLTHKVFAPLSSLKVFTSFFFFFFDNWKATRKREDDNDDDDDDEEDEDDWNIRKPLISLLNS